MLLKFCLCLIIAYTALYIAFHLLGTKKQIRTLISICLAAVAGGFALTLGAIYENVSMIIVGIVIMATASIAITVMTKSIFSPKKKPENEKLRVLKKQLKE